MNFRLWGMRFLFCAVSMLSFGAGRRVALEPSMVTNESDKGEPGVLVDEQELAGDPPAGAPEKQWQINSQFWKSHFPLHAYLDLGSARRLSAVWLYDTNGMGDFVVSAGEPGKWRELFTDDCVGYKKWKEHRVDVVTRHLRFTRKTPGANVAEVVVYEFSADEARAIDERDALQKRAEREAANRPRIDAGAPFGALPLVDEVDCAKEGAAHLFTEFPKGASRVETILGAPCRVLPNAGDSMKYFAYRVGRHRLLKPGAAYVLSVEFPEDQSRGMFVMNRGAETARGLRTGAALGDALHMPYVNGNPSSLKIPLSGKFRAWKMLFYLHDRFPDLQQPRGDGVRPHLPWDGFWVIVAQPKAINDPASAGAAVSRIRLFEAPDPKRFDVALRLPPKGLPRRHIFYREEMSDGVIHSSDETQRGVKRDVDWFEHQARLMRFLGINTFCKDLLEFGHNQGWDSTAGGGNNWVNQAAFKQRWSDALVMLGKYDFSVLPYYEYAGSVGGNSIGVQRRCVTLAGTKTYTHITWSEKANADVTDPETLADAKKVLDFTIVRHKDKVDFLGAWFRPRPTHMPISFSDRCLALFATEGNGGTAATREQLRADKALLERYYAWWFGKRRDFLTALRDHLREKVNPEAVILLTTDSSESGRSLPGWDKRVVTDDPARWTQLLKADKAHEKITAIAHDEVVRRDLHLQALLEPHPTWGEWEWQHSCPTNDPANYAQTPGALLTYTFNRAYTVESAKAFDAFRTPSGLAVVRHYTLNEDVLDKKLGYFSTDVERAGPYCMLAEARAMAHGDPRFLGYLASSRFNRGFPEYVRDFNAAFLALPALPSKIVKDACADSEVVVRAIETKSNGVYLAVVNTGLTEKRDVAIALPAKGKVTDATTGQMLTVNGGRLTLSLQPCQLRALHLE